jgi:hypothetical protein
MSITHVGLALFIPEGIGTYILDNVGEDLPVFLIDITTVSAVRLEIISRAIVGVIS